VILIRKLRHDINIKISSGLIFDTWSIVSASSHFKFHWSSFT